MIKRRVWKGLLAGAAAGAAGSLAMNQFQKLWTRVAEQRKGTGHSRENSTEDATMKVAGKMAEILGHPLSREQRVKAGPLVHYAFGTGTGALYGGLIEAGPRHLRRHALLSGMGFGSMLFAGVDEGMVPALRLSGPPWKSPLSSHLYAFASHMVYGLTVGAVRRRVRSAL